MHAPRTCPRVQTRDLDPLVLDGLVEPDDLDALVGLRDVALLVELAPVGPGLVPGRGGEVDPAPGRSASSAKVPAGRLADEVLRDVLVEGARGLGHEDLGPRLPDDVAPRHDVGERSAVVGVEVRDEDAVQLHVVDAVQHGKRIPPVLPGVDPAVKENGTATKLDQDARAPDLQSSAKGSDDYLLTHFSLFFFFFFFLFLKNEWWI